MSVSAVTRCLGEAEELARNAKEGLSFTLINSKWLQITYYAAKGEDNAYFTYTYSDMARTRDYAEQLWYHVTIF